MRPFPCKVGEGQEGGGSKCSAFALLAPSLTLPRFAEEGTGNKHGYMRG
jgi:hypothetical protein